MRDSRFDGNCGMFAIAVAEAARGAGREARIVLAHDAESEDHFHRGHFHLYHVAVDVDGVLCDARGRIASDDEVLSFMAPNLPEAKIERFPLDDELKFVIRRKTRWTVSFEKYAEDAERILAEIEKRS